MGIFNRSPVIICSYQYERKVIISLVIYCARSDSNVARAWDISRKCTIITVKREFLTQVSFMCKLITVHYEFLILCMVFVIFNYFYYKPTPGFHLYNTFIYQALT